MKIRIKGSTLRLRLSQDEVRTLEETGLVTEECKLLNSSFTYSLLSGDQEKITADIQENHIRVIMPKSMVGGWFADKKIGYSETMSNGCFLLIEKDFQCLVPRDHEDESNLYKNPRAK